MGDFLEKISNNGISIFFDSVSYGVRWFISNCKANGYNISVNIDTVENVYLNTNNDIVIRSGLNTDVYKYTFILEKNNKSIPVMLTFTETSREYFPYELLVYTL